MTSRDYSTPAATLEHGAMPLLGFGTWQISDRDAEGAVAAALDAGYRHIDTATMYRNERGVGRAIAASGLARDQVFVTTKLPPESTGRERATIDESLSKLGLDHVDLWLIHWPPRRDAGAEVWKQFAAAQADGLATAIGVSNYSLDEIDQLIDETGVTPEVNQVRWSPALYDPAFVTGLRERGVALEGYSPFKSMNLEDPRLTQIASAHDATTAQVVVAWHVQHGFVVIPKSARPERIVANARGVDLTLSPDELAAVDALGAAAP